MIGKLLVSSEEMRSAASELDSYVNKMEEYFSQMKNLVDQSEGYWDGKAAKAHRTSYNKNLKNIEEIINRYREHVKDLNEMAGVYYQAELTAFNAADTLPNSIL